MLKDTHLANQFSLQKLAEETDGLSGSDLKEMCRNAAMRPMREFIREAEDVREKLDRCQEEVSYCFHFFCSFTHKFSCSKGFKLRPLTFEDFFQADGTSALPPTNILEDIS